MAPSRPNDRLAYTRLTSATEKLIAAEAAYLVGLAAGEPMPAQYAALAHAQRERERAALAVHMFVTRECTPGTVRLVAVDYREGDQWTPMLGAGRYDVLSGETASAQALRVACERRFVGTGLPWRVRVWSDPRPNAEPAAEWVNPAVTD
ncbi:hypothetical protein AB0F93_03600 [Micromonospora tulbaghiae]|uniref:hypothetical protein n=1 Tax=Micromonospora tulbaghiae TaxID=479978 RepID=UPI003330C292